MKEKGKVIFVDGGITFDTATVLTTASQNLIMTFENLTNTADIYRMALLINGEEYGLERNNSNEMSIEQVAELSWFYGAATEEEASGVMRNSETIAEKYKA